MAYGTDVVDLYRRMASYVDQILKGANPGNLPVQAQTRFHTRTDLTARSCCSHATDLGLTHRVYLF